MTLQHFYKFERSIYSDNLKYYEEKIENNGHLDTPLITREKLIKRFEEEIDIPFDDIDNYTDEENEKLFEQTKNEIVAEYDRFIAKYKEFIVLQ